MMLARKRIELGIIIITTMIQRQKDKHHVFPRLHKAWIFNQDIQVEEGLLGKRKESVGRGGQKKVNERL